MSGSLQHWLLAQFSAVPEHRVDTQLGNSSHVKSSLAGLTTASPLVRGPMGAQSQVSATEEFWLKSGGGGQLAMHRANDEFFT
mmetsp:Transcript_21863/g.57049  ORF Transcript_21863/g.57049 Transcript_21863/m.57049 type:complete len:83 (-) Transcript_21863:1070-1318(-)